MAFKFNYERVIEFGPFLINKESLRGVVSFIVSKYHTDVKQREGKSYLWYPDKII